MAGESPPAWIATGPALTDFSWPSPSTEDTATDATDAAAGADGVAGADGQFAGGNFGSFGEFGGRESPARAIPATPQGNDAASVAASNMFQSCREGGGMAGGSPGSRSGRSSGASLASAMPAC